MNATKPQGAGVMPGDWMNRKLLSVTGRVLWAILIGLTGSIVALGVTRISENEKRLDMLNLSIRLNTAAIEANQTRILHLLPAKLLDDVDSLKLNYVELNSKVDMLLFHFGIAKIERAVPKSTLNTKPKPIPEGTP